MTQQIGLIKRLIEAAKTETGIEVGTIVDDKLIMDRSRKFNNVLIKACIMNLLNKHHGLGVAEIGKILGMDHSTVIHHVKAHPYRYGTEDFYYDVYNALANESREAASYSLDAGKIIKIIREI